MLLPLIAAAQKDTVGLNLPYKDGKIVYERIVDVPGLNKQDLYKNAKQWFVDYFKSSKDVIQNEDKEEGTIIGKGIIPYVFHIKIMGNYTKNDHLTVQVSAKDNKYRIRIYDQIIISPENELNQDAFTTPEGLAALLSGPGKFGLNKPAIRSELASCDAAVKSAIASLNDKMKSKPDDF